MDNNNQHIDNLFRLIIIKNQYTRQKIFNHVSIIHQQLNIPIVKYQHIKCSLYTLIQYNFTNTFIKHFKRVYDQLKSYLSPTRHKSYNDFDMLNYILDIVLVSNNTRALTFMLDQVKLSNSTSTTLSIDCTLQKYGRVYSTNPSYSFTLETVKILLDSGIKITNSYYSTAMIETLISNGQIEILKTRITTDQLRRYNPTSRHKCLDRLVENKQSVLETLNFLATNNILLHSDQSMVQSIVSNNNNPIPSTTVVSTSSNRNLLDLKLNHGYKIMSSWIDDDSPSSTGDWIKHYFSGLLHNNETIIQQCQDYFSSQSPASIANRFSSIW
ncbi:hypothetical protein DFA_03019 [Cavenderia fasciculata]|uniref:Uncharacterized protein n=1 Tax=Cavenderia fasciculata TaxID=261658 RepID=F4PGE1_CACFS|nr:uncharacterized protein DFA_03019 [Cavenderia fasciculata]EGG24775.1 hypothetical protein DFA_03019 [Cavenderia fasciculata]|eukprot:XP_004362626.1 hypothetical protein DFA_03019 [Cavenderia fasciculata]